MPNDGNSEQSIPQRDRFIEAARELGCDESEEAFTEVVRKVATPTRKRASKAEWMTPGDVDEGVKKARDLVRACYRELA